MRKEDLSTDTTFNPCWFSLDYSFLLLMLFLTILSSLSQSSETVPWTNLWLMKLCLAPDSKYLFCQQDVVQILGKENARGSSWLQKFRKIFVLCEAL
jgi:hypothetical protein